jgi:hypothetical protein
MCGQRNNIIYLVIYCKLSPANRNRTAIMKRNIKYPILFSSKIFVSFIKPKQFNSIFISIYTGKVYNRVKMIIVSKSRPVCFKSLIYVLLKANLFKPQCNNDKSPLFTRTTIIKSEVYLNLHFVSKLCFF